MLRLAILTALIVGAIVVADGRERVGRALYEAGAHRVGALLLGGPAWSGAALYERKAYPEAAAAFRREEFPGQLYDLGTALARAGQLRDAAETFDAALARDPNDEDARYNLALVEAMLAKQRESDKRDAQNGANATATQNKHGGDANEENEQNSTGEGATGDRDSGRQAQTQGASKAYKAGRAEQARSQSESRKASGSIGAGEGIGRTGDAAMNVSQLPDQPSLKLQGVQLRTIRASRQWLETLPDDPGVYVRRRLQHERDERKARGVAAPEMTDQW